MSHLDSSLAGAIADHAANRPAAPALRFKARGRWRALTWAALDAEVALLARGLTAAGVRRGERVWLVGAPAPRLLAFLFAVERVGAVPVPVDGAGGSSTTTSGARHRTTGERAGEAPTAPVAFVEDSEALDALAALIAASGRAGDDRLPTTIVFDDPRGLRASADERLQGYESFREGAVASSSPPQLRRGPGGGSVRALLLPLGWRDDALAIIRLWARSSLELCLTERQGNLEADLREVAPRVLLGAATTTADLLAGVLERLPPTGTRRRRFIDGSLATATTGAGIARKLTRALVRLPLRRVLGLHRTRLALVAGLEIAAPARALLDGLGIRLSVVGHAVDDRSNGARVLALPLERTPPRGPAGTTWREAIVP